SRGGRQGRLSLYALPRPPASERRPLPRPARGAGRGARCGRGNDSLDFLSAARGESDTTRARGQARARWGPGPPPHPPEVIMNALTRPRLPIAGLGALALLLPVGPLARPAAAQAAPAAPSFEKDVRPILQAHCARCHGTTARKGGLDVRN